MKKFRKSLQAFFEKEVHPYVEEWEKNGKVDRSVLKEKRDKLKKDLVKENK